MFRWLHTARFVDNVGRLTAEATRALSPSKDPFKPVKIPIGAPLSFVDVLIQTNDQGFYFIKNFNQLNTAVTVTRGTVGIDVVGSSPIPVNPGDTIKFTYTYDTLAPVSLLFSPL